MKKSTQTGANIDKQTIILHQKKNSKEQLKSLKKKKKKKRL